MDDLFREGKWKIIGTDNWAEVIHACGEHGFDCEYPIYLGVKDIHGVCHLCKEECPEKIKTLYILLDSGMEVQ